MNKALLHDIRTAKAELEQELILREKMYSDPLFLALKKKNRRIKALKEKICNLALRLDKEKEV